MITGLTLENFKCFGKEVQIDLKPLTLLFGPNSAGKSTVVQALHYLSEVVLHNRCNPDRTGSGGNVVDLGGFQRLIHGHDSTKKIRIRVDLDDSGAFETYIPYLDIPNDQQGRILTEDIVGSWESAWVEIVVSWSEQHQDAWVSLFRTGINGTWFAEIRQTADGNRAEITEINYEHPLLWDPRVEDYAFEAENPSILEYVADLLGYDWEGPAILERIPIPLERMKGQTIPKAGMPLELGIGTNPVREGPLAEDFQEQRVLVGALSQGLVGPVDSLRKELEKMCYVGPLRTVPDRNFQPGLSGTHGDWSDGLGAWAWFWRCSDKELEEVNDWLDAADRLKLGYKVQREHLKNSFNSPVLQQVTLKDSNQDIFVYPSEVGSGIAQVIPVVAAALNPSFKIVSIEQPELHVHPALQTHLGDLFGHAAVKGNRLMIIETHSEHLMLRLMRRIREFHNGDLLKGKPELTRDHLSVIYVEAGGKAKSLRVTRDGDFMDEWPEGFFEERLEELF